MSADRGLPLIATLVLINGASAAWCIADLHADLRLRRANAIAEANLTQAEGMLKACFRHGGFTVGTAIYHCQAKKSELTTAHVPELSHARVF